MQELSLRGVTAETRCGCCGAEFADHTYDEPEKAYKCPTPHVESGYGFFAGGDPRDFSPDGESCTPKEIANHKAACALWNEAAGRGETPEPEKCPSGWLYDEAGKPIMHVLRAPYGIGVYSYEFDRYFEMPDDVGPVDIDDDEDLVL